MIERDTWELLLRGRRWQDWDRRWLFAPLRGEHAGRKSDERITVYSPVGLPLQDCVIAWHAYRNAIAAGLGTSLHLEKDS